MAKAKVIEESAFDPRKYSYRRKVEPSKQWTKSETYRFYKCLMNLGTDFSMIGQYFPGRTRAQIKRKYKTEERKNPDLINGALSTTLHYNGDLIDNMFQDEEDLKLKEDKEAVIKQPNSQPRHKSVKRSDCSNTMSVCALMMEEEVVLKKKREPKTKRITSASKLKGDVLLLKNLKGKNKKNIESNNSFDKECETTCTKVEAKEEPKTKVRRLQDFHEEYEETVTKYEDSNSD